MLVYEIRLKLLLKKSVPYYESGEVISRMINQSLCREPEYLTFHEYSKDYKFYCFDNFYPFEKSGVYRAGSVYGIRLRTVREDLAEYFSGKLLGEETDSVMCLKADIRLMPKKRIEKIFSLTPAVMKNYPDGYWRESLTTQQFEKRLLENLLKKYRALTGKALKEDFMLYNGIRFLNGKPIKTSYKGISLLGDKVEMIAAQNETAQELMYMALGSGILENNANGCGFVHCS